MMVELNVNDEQEIARSGRTTKSSKLSQSQWVKWMASLLMEWWWGHRAGHSGGAGKTEAPGLGWALFSVLLYTHNYSREKNE